MADTLGQFDDTIVAPPAPIVMNRQPPNIQRLTQMSGKSPNAVKVEYEQKLRDINDNLMKEPPNMLDNSNSVQLQANIQAFDELEDEYKNGETSEDDDEVTYDELVGDISTDIGQDPSALDFNMFPPGEQQSANQMMSDIDAINSESDVLPSEPDDLNPFDMDDLEKIAEPEDDEVPTEDILTDEEAPDIPE